MPQFTVDAQELCDASESNQWHINDAAVAEPGQFRADEAKGAVNRYGDLRAVQLAAHGVDLLEEAVHE